MSGIILNVNSYMERIRELQSIIDELRRENERLKEEITRKDEIIRKNNEDLKELRNRVSMNSTNSSMPPSFDGYAKPSPKSMRKKTNRKRGGQIGHKGHHMEIPHEPDLTVNHYPPGCVDCPNRTKCDSNGSFTCSEKRYVVGIEMRTTVVEHCQITLDCPCDKMLEESNDVVLSGTFPTDVSAYVQYDDSVSIFVTQCSTHGAVSMSRISSFMRDNFGVGISPGTIESMIFKSSEKVKSSLEEIRDHIIKSDVTNNDETGIRVNGKLYWVHDTSTADATCQTVSEKRGSEGIKGHGILTKSKCIAVTDRWPSYFKIENIDHGICCAHLLRDLKGIEEMEPEHIWPKMFAEHLLHMKKMKEVAQSEKRTEFNGDELKHFSDKYDQILAIAESECPSPPKPIVKKRGRLRKGKERSLIEALRSMKGYVCKFTTDFRVPFDNNLAERDIRNIKTKTKVSGCFRSKHGAQAYLDIMSFLSTARKRGIGVTKAFRDAYDGHVELFKKDG